MERKRRVVLLFCVLFFLGIMGPCLGRAEETETTKGGATTEKGYDDNWHFLFYLPLWLPAMSGDVKAKGVTVPVNVGYIEQLENLFNYVNSMAVGHLEVNKGRWVLLLEGIYGKFIEKENFSTQINIPIISPIEIPVTGSLKVTVAELIAESSLLYDVYRSDSTIGNRPVLTVEALAGARTLYFTTKASVTGPLGVFSRNKDNTIGWVDPILGGRVLWNLSDRWLAGFRADVGGFGLVSQFTLNLDGFVTYRANNWLRFMGGFRGLYEDHHGGSGNDSFIYKMWMYAPWMGVGVAF
jgi:hypothetical protein